MTKGRHKSFDILEPYLRQSKRTLEMGAGCGLISIEALLQAAVKEPWAVDISAEAVE